jgi:dinuclear metal center YbgI/SA1388 family protein
MKTTVADVCQYLESIAPLGLQESYDNAGLIAGEKDWEVKGVLCSLDATAEVVLEAVERGCNLVVAHHPIVFRGLKQVNRSHYVGRAVVEAIKNDVAIYAVHTNLDNVLDNGVNREIATRLGLTDLTILAPRPENAATGSGLLGYLPEAMGEGDFLRKVKNEMQAGCIRHSAFSGKNIQRVAVCGGAGSFLIHHALDAGAEAFVTSDVKYHEFFEADGRLLYMDIGHYESEQYTISLLERLISGKFLNFAAYCTKRNTNPVHYY